MCNTAMNSVTVARKVRQHQARLSLSFEYPHKSARAQRELVLGVRVSAVDEPAHAPTLSAWALVAVAQIRHGCY